MAASAIEWTDATWNPVTGCSKVSPGCKLCYAERMSARLKAMGQPKYRDGFAVRCHPGELSRPLRWRKPRLVFVNSMSDLFHESVPRAFVLAVFDAMLRAHWHTFQVLTKRPGRALQLQCQRDGIDWPPNVWLGVSAEDQRRADERVPALLETSAAVLFLSLEPLLGPLPRLELGGIDWVIAGGESGPGARPMEAGWVRAIRDQCVRSRVPFFFKQWGGINKKRGGRILDGRTWDEFPLAGLPGPSRPT